MSLLAHQGICSWGQNRPGTYSKFSKLVNDVRGRKTDGVARLETSFVIYQLVSIASITTILQKERHTTSTPRFRATAMTVLSVPRSTPTTLMFTDCCLLFLSGLSNLVQSQYIRKRIDTQGAPMLLERKVVDSNVLSWVGVRREVK